MLTANQITNIILIVLIGIHFSVLIVGIKTNRAGLYISMLNLVAGASVLFYWIQKQVSIKQHFIDTMEILMIGFEIALVAAAIYLLVSKKVTSWVVIMQYVFFGIHFLALVLFFIFMLCFKIKRLI